MLICGVLVLDVAHYLPLVPDPMASHFGLSGRPNGWSSHFRMIAGLTVLVLVFAAIFAVTFFFSRVPDRLISLPNKTYWLAPERREATPLVRVGLAALVPGADARLYHAPCWSHLSRQSAHAATVVGRRAWGASHLPRRSGDHDRYPRHAFAQTSLSFFERRRRMLSQGWPCGAEHDPRARLRRVLDAQNSRRSAAPRRTSLRRWTAPLSTLRGRVCSLREPISNRRCSLQTLMVYAKPS